MNFRQKSAERKLKNESKSKEKSIIVQSPNKPKEQPKPIEIIKKQKQIIQ
jgi:hypothetical protein